MKKVLIIILVALITLLPTIAATVLYFIPDDALHAPISVGGSMYNDLGIHYNFSKNENESLALFFNSLFSHSTKAGSEIGTPEYDEAFSVNLTQRDSTVHFLLYLSIYGDCYYTDENGELWLINKDYSDQLINSKYALSLYQSSYTPELLTYSKEAIAPIKTEFNYTTKNNSSINHITDNSKGEPTVYHSSRTAQISFTKDPYICNIEVYINDLCVYRGSLDQYDPSIVDQKAKVRFVIDATWEKSEKNLCFGTAHYDFYVDYHPAPTFSIDKSSINAGEFLTIKAGNILDPSKIECEFSGGMTSSTGFFEKDGYYYAMIPFDMNLQSGVYSLTLSYGETLKVFNVSIKERNRGESATVYDIHSPITDQSLSDMTALIASIGLNSSDKFYTSEPFINYEESYADVFYFKLGFGRVRNFTSGRPFDMIGIEFSSSEGISIPVINSGVVCASGENELIGKYIVVEHGFGLKSWYCNISEILYSVGDNVKKGDLIAKTGSSAFYGQPGFYLITTILDTPVSPYVIYEENFVLPQ